MAGPPLKEKKGVSREPSKPTHCLSAARTVHRNILPRITP